jgi:hypothetical protein
MTLTSTPRLAVAQAEGEAARAERARAAAALEAEAAKRAAEAAEVRKTPSWPRSWANPSLF